MQTFFLQVKSQSVAQQKSNKQRQQSLQFKQHEIQLKTKRHTKKSQLIFHGKPFLLTPEIWSKLIDIIFQA